MSAYIRCNVISNLELGRSDNAIQRELLLSSGNTLSDFRRREYTLTVDVITMQMLSRNYVSLAVDGWTSTNKFAITSFIAYYMDWNWALQEVQQAFDEVDSSFCSYFDSWLKITGEGSTYWSMASQTLEGSSWWFRVRWLQFTWNYNR